MGRTLHYFVSDKSFVPSDEQQLAIYKLTDKYAGEIEWTAEAPSFDFYDYVPNWERLKPLHGHNLSADEGWAIVEKRLKEYAKTGMTKIDARNKAEQAGLIWFTHNSTDRMRSFVKTSGNELNAHAVIRFVIECSKILSGIQLHLVDEGDALYCPVMIKDGLAKPDRQKIKKYIKFWNEPDRYEAVHGKYEDVTKKEQYYNELLKRRFSFGDPNQFIRTVKPEAYLNKRKLFKTMRLEKDDVEKLETIGRSFLADERAESGSYYDDINSFLLASPNRVKVQKSI